MAKILAIDLGTTYFKFALLDRNGRLCDTCRIAPPLVGNEAVRMEMPADAFADAIRRGIAELRNRAHGSLADVAAITFATQTNSFLLLDGGDVFAHAGPVGATTVERHLADGELPPVGKRRREWAVEPLRRQ